MKKTVFSCVNYLFFNSLQIIVDVSVVLPRPREVFFCGDEVLVDGEVPHEREVAVQPHVVVHRLLHGGPRGHALHGVGSGVGLTGSHKYNDKIT